MKTISYLLLVVLHCTTLSLYAQSSNATNHFSIFFERGNAFLTPTALATLDAIAGNLPPDSLEFHVSLQGFGDEGTTPSDLGKDRALSVGRYLQSKGVNPKRVQITQPDHIALSRVYENQVAVQRVDIQLSQKIYANVQSLLSSLDAEKPSLYRISTQSPQTLYTQKGTALSLPTNAFVLADGSAYQGQVQFLVKEAFNYKEMIANNLHTSSEGKLLETGGMIYLEALDTLGRALQLAEGKEISFSLPTEQASLPRMQVFSAQYSENGDMEWVAGDYWTKVSTERSKPTPLFTGRLNSDLTSLPQTQALLKHFLSFNPQQLPERLDTSFLPERPVYPSYMPYKDRADLERHHVKSHKESDKSYVARIDDLYKKYIHDPINEYNKKSEAYQPDSLAFLQTNPDYISYCKELLQSFQYIYEHTRYLTHGQFFAPVSKAEDVVKNSYSKTSRLELDVYFLQNKYHHADIKPLLSPLKALETELSGYKKTLSSVINSINRSFQLSSYQWTSFLEAMEKLEVELRGKQVLSEYYIHEIIKLHNQLLTQMPFRNLQIEVQPIYQAIQTYQPIGARIEKIETSFWDIQKQIFEKQKELGLLTEEDIFNIYNNAMKINRLGWINCDRFVDDVSPRTDLHILAGQPTNNQTTKYYLVFQDIKSLMPFEPQGNGLAVKNIPSGQQATIVGIRVEGGATASVFTQSGKIGELENNINPVFEARNIDEVMALLTQN